MKHKLFAGLIFWCAFVPGLLTAERNTTSVMEVLLIEEVTAIMRSEGLRYAETLNDEMLDGQGGAFWQQQVLGIYALHRMIEHVRKTLSSGLDTEQSKAVISFFSQAPGREFIARETLAREAMLDEAVEKLAREQCQSPEPGDAAYVSLIDRFIETADLIERNVAGALSSNFSFYLGLADGGMLDLPQESILQNVYADEADIRVETEDWLCGYFLLAYRPLSLDALETYTSFFGSDAGRALNAALFDGYEAMYRELSYAMGRAVALNAKGDDI